MQGLQAVTQPSPGQVLSSASPQVAFQVSFSSITAAAAQPTQVLSTSSKPSVLLLDQLVLARAPCTPFETRLYLCNCCCWRSIAVIPLCARQYSFTSRHVGAE